MSEQVPSAPNAADGDLHGEAERRRIEDGLLTIPGLTAVRLVPGYDRAVDELHVVTSPERPPKQTVRDIQSYLYATFGLSIDHRVVSVVQLAAESSAVDSPVSSARAAITEVTTSHQDLLCRATVRLRSGPEILEGTGEGPSSAAGRRRAVAHATLEAAQPLLDPLYVVELEAVSASEMATATVMLSVVQLYGPRGERVASGSAVVTTDELLAVARSVLDALNREMATDRDAVMDLS